MTYEENLTLIAAKLTSDEGLAGLLSKQEINQRNRRIEDVKTHCVDVICTMERCVKSTDTNHIRRQLSDALGMINSAILLVHTIEANENLVDRLAECVDLGREVA
jgi:hypothetical protein